MSVIAVAGDWDGASPWAQQKVSECGERGVRVLLHAGDFGIAPGKAGKRYLMAVEKACARHGVTLLVTPGNHEDWGRLSIKGTRDRGDGWGAVQWLTQHIAVLPRGHRFTVAGRSFVSLGGAPSVNRHALTEGVNWWPAEAITRADVDATIAGGPAEVMISHDAPNGGTDKVAEIVATNPLGFPSDALTYAAEGRTLLTEAFRGVGPQVLFHGHYHVDDTKQVVVPHLNGVLDPDRTCRVVSLNQQHRSGNIAYLDLDSLSVRNPPRPVTVPA